MKAPEAPLTGSGSRWNVLPLTTALPFPLLRRRFAFRVDAEEPVARRFQNACRELFLPGTLLSTYGGSDNNHFFQHGIRGLVAASGMNNCHSCSEYTSVSELMKASELTLALMLRED